MNSNSNDWSDVNAAIRKALDEISRTDASCIRCLELHEYSISICISNMDISVWTAVDLVDSGRVVYSLRADCRHRTASSFGVCQVVGMAVSDCACDDSGVHLSLADGRQLVGRREDEFENYAIGGAFPVFTM